MNIPLVQPLLVLLVALSCSFAQAAHYKLFVLTGQSNSLGTTAGGETDPSPGADPADAKIKFYWSNLATATTALGDSGGVFTTLQSQQRGYYSGSATHWGPEVAFARTLYRAGVRDFGIIKASRGGGGNTFWLKNSADDHMYDHVVATVASATATLTAQGDTFEIVGLLYLQGESDTAAEAAAAGTRLQTLVTNLRSDLPNAAALHGVAGGIAAAGTDRDTVRANQSAIAAVGSSGNGVGDPCILFDPATSTLWVAALWSFGNHGYSGSGAGTDPTQTGQYVLTKSTDSGLTWSAPINNTTAVKDDVNWRLVFQGPGHGLAMRNGTLVFPSQRINAAGVVQSCSVFSTDHGVTWDFGSAVPTTSPTTNENTVCELDDGRLLFSMRTPSGSNGQRAWAHYTPGGAQPLRGGTWSSLYRLPAVPDPVCQGSVIQWTSTHRGHPREQILYVGPGTSASRTNLTLRLSGDGGATWPVSRLIYAGSSAYSSMCILPDNSIGILFERDNYTKITFVRIEPDWIFDPASDADSDGLPDAWESFHNIADPAADNDGDGRNNLGEYASGTDPRSAASVLRATGFQPQADGWHFTWQAVPGRSYQIEVSEDLANWSATAIQQPASEEGSFTLAPSAAQRLFLRARALP